MKLRLRVVRKTEVQPGIVYALSWTDPATKTYRVETQAVLEFWGEIEQPPNSTDGEGNPIYDGPTIEGWQPVPVVTADREGEHG